MRKNTVVLSEKYSTCYTDGSSSAGRFKYESKVIRAGLRLLDEDENRIKLLRTAILEGVDSKIVRDFDPENHLKIMKNNKTTNA